MSIKKRAILGALALFGGLLIAIGAGVTKSTASIKYERDVERHKADPLNPERPMPAVPGNTGANVVLVLGLLVAAGGPFLIYSAVRDMTAQIGDAQSQAESAMRMELHEKRDPKPKP